MSSLIFSGTDFTALPFVAAHFHVEGLPLKGESEAAICTWHTADIDPTILVT
jgi:hypothetical protein